MTNEFDHLKQWIADMATLINEDAEPKPLHYSLFIQQPELAVYLIDLIDGLDEHALENNHAYYSAAVFALDICVSQLQTAYESGNKSGGKALKHLMDHMAAKMKKSSHSLNFWLPIINAFYEFHVELTPVLRDAYLSLAEDEEDSQAVDLVDHLEAIRMMIEDLSDLSVFDIAENFFAQSYAMPEDFFIDLVIDLFSIEQGNDIAILMLLHPNASVRGVVVATIDELINKVELSPASLSRLQVIKNWYPADYHEQFTRWIKVQRRKGVVFNQEKKISAFTLKASEIDGCGAQGLFVHIKKPKANRLCGLLIKQDVGIKDAWITPIIPAQQIKGYYEEAFDHSVTLREIETDYLVSMINHFLAITIEHGGMPDLHLLEIQEMLGLHFYPQRIEVTELIEELSIKISPFTDVAMQASFKRSKAWSNNKKFTESWYLENPHIDKLVNRCSSFVNGVRVCNIEKAMDTVFEQELELNRDKWRFHFLWAALWMKSKPRKSERLWEDSFFIAYAIEQGLALKSIPLMQEICRQTIINSVETMNERRTHLSKE